MLHPSVFFTADYALGRVGYTEIPDQALLEMLIEGADERYKARFMVQGAYRDISEWDGVVCGPDGTVLHLTMANEPMGALYAYGGTLALQFLPPNLTEFTCRTKLFTGTIDMAELPASLRHFTLTTSNFEGPLGLSTMPSALKHLNLSGNFFSGSCDLTALPSGMQYVDLSNNHLTGSVSLDALPAHLLLLRLRCNALSGEIHIQNLSSNLQELYLDNNCFSGEFKLLCLSEKLNTISASNNALMGTAVLPKGINPRKTNVMLLGNSIGAVGDEMGDAHALERRILRDQREKPAVCRCANCLDKEEWANE